VTAVLPRVRRIVVLRANALGDYLLAEPALRALRACYPGAWITLLGAPWQRLFLTERPSPVDEVRVLPSVAGLAGQPPGAPPAEELPAVLDGIRRTRPDLAIQLHGGGATSNPLVNSLGARRTAGLRAPGAARLDREIPYRYYQPEIERYLEVVGLVGAEPVNHEPSLALTEADHREAEALLPTDRPSGAPLVALHPGVSDPRRRWPGGAFAQVARALHAAGARVVLTGAPVDSPLTAEIADSARVPVLDLTGRTGLGGLGAVYRRCAAVVGVDTGPLHLARAVDAATVTLFWCGNALNAGPAQRARHRAVLSWTMNCPECGAPCHSDLYPLRGLGTGCHHTPSYLTDIPAAEVITEALDLLGKPAL